MSHFAANADGYDVDELPSVIRDGLEVEYVQLEANRFAARWTIAEVPGAVIQISRVNVSVVRRLRAPADRWVLVVPLTTAGHARWDGRSLSSDEILVCRPATQSFAWDPGGAGCAFISMSPGRIQFGVPRAMRGSDETFIVRVEGLDAIRERLLSISDGAAATGGWGTNPARDAIQSLMANINRGAGARTAVANGSPITIVRRADALIRGCHSLNVSVRQLSSKLQVSERCLRKAFGDVLGISPKHYLQLRQLHGIRRVLRRASSHPMKVTEAMVDHGVNEFGRVATRYRLLFGEKPSETVRNRRSGRQESGVVRGPMRPAVSSASPYEIRPA